MEEVQKPFTAVERPVQLCADEEASHLVDAKDELGRQQANGVFNALHRKEDGVACMQGANLSLSDGSGSTPRPACQAAFLTGASLVPRRHMQALHAASLSRSGADAPGSRDHEGSGVGKGPRTVGQGAQDAQEL